MIPTSLADAIVVPIPLQFLGVAVEVAHATVDTCHVPPGSTTPVYVLYPLQGEFFGDPHISGQAEVHESIDEVVYEIRTKDQLILGRRHVSQSFSLSGADGA